nr:hypothetical protein GCM10020241_64430 [Streptoalloteichus tenebrarius]
MRAGGDPAEHLLRLPTGTTLRFLVLLLLALATAALAHSTASPPAARFADEITRCEILNAPPASTGLDGYATYAEAAVADAGFRECVRPITLRISGYVATGVGSLLLLATALYWLRPVWIIWRRRLVPLPGAPEFDVIRAELADLTARSGLGRRPPVFLIDPFHGRRTGFVFGRGRRPLVCLSGGLLALHGRDRAAFRAIVRHELAHVRNRDVAITGWTIAVWRAFLVTAALPFAVALSGIEVSEDLTVGRPSLDRLADPDVWWISLRLALLAALVYLSRNAILRARELEADLRAGPEGMTVHSGATRDPWWRRWISHHPPASVRRRVVEDPVWWARPRFGALAATGVVIGLVVGHGDQATWILITTRAPAGGHPPPDRRLGAAGRRARSGRLAGGAVRAPGSRSARRPRPSRDRPRGRRRARTRGRTQPGPVRPQQCDRVGRQCGVRRRGRRRRSVDGVLRAELAA